ncbi:MAG: hypothetical protein ACTS22_07120 [Phycisphaerales bacterium]
MAARTSAGFGIIFTISLLGLISAVLFVVALIQFSDNGKLRQELNDQEATNREFIRQAERADPVIAAELTNARSENESLVGYLLGQLETTYGKVTGNSRDRVESLNQKIQGIPGADTGNLLAVIRGLRTQIATLEQARADADAGRLAAEDRLREATERVNALDEQQRQTVARLQNRVAQLEQDATQYRDGLAGIEQRFAQELAQERQEAEGLERTLRQQISQLQQRNLVLEDQVSRLQGEARGSTLTAKDEASLVDGSIVNTNPNDREVFISLGRRDNVILGMTFSVYSDAAQIRPDPATGEYPRGKGAIEVVNVGETSSRCRILSERTGNPLVAGDVIANAVYDPDKRYKFLIAGNFDTNGDRQQTPAERAEIVALIQDWGGITTDEFAGDVDFLVLGAAPVLPPEPGVTSPIAVVEQYIRREAELKRYNELLDQARRTSVPVLNENRLYTLIGRVQSRTR